jgi:hypothetical protein
MISTLVVRGLVGLAFAGYLLTFRTASPEAYYEILSRYLIVDGLAASVIGLALLAESVVTKRERELGIGIVVFVDAAGRMLSGVALTIWPGIAGFPVTAVMFVAIMAACTAAVGLVEAGLTAREEIARHGAGHQPPQIMAGPVGLASLVSTAFGIAAIAAIGSPETLQSLISCFVGAAGVVALAMGWSRARMVRQWRSAAPGSRPVS